MYSARPIPAPAPATATLLLSGAAALESATAWPGKSTASLSDSTRRRGVRADTIAIMPEPRPDSPPGASGTAGGQSPNPIARLLARVREGTLDPLEAEHQLRLLGAGHPDRSLEFATIDDHRRERCGSAEVIFGQGKTAGETIAIAREVLTTEPMVLITRLRASDFEPVRAALAGEFVVEASPRCGGLLVGEPPNPVGPAIPIVTAGTSDGHVAAEAELTCRAMGCLANRINDVGVAGLHRLVDRLPELRAGRVVLCVAGMEAALPSVVDGLVAAPVIAVPTSVGYGANFGGLSALLGSLTSCASGVAVVNIDNGFGGAFIACRIHRLAGA